MIQSVARSLADLLPRRRRLEGLLLAFESFLAGLLEAVVLVLVVQSGVAITSGDDTIDIELPVVDIADLTVGSALAVALVAGVGVLCLHLHGASLTARLSATVLDLARDRAIRAFARAEWDRQSKERQGALQETVSTLALQTSTLMSQMIQGVTAVLGLIALIGSALLVNVAVTAVAVALGGVVFAMIRPLTSITRRLARRFVALNSNFSEAVAQWGSLAMELTVFGVSDTQALRMEDLGDDVAEAQRRMRRASRAGAALYRDLAIIMMVAATAALYNADDISIADTGAVLLLVVRSLTYGQQLNQALQQLSEQSPGLEALESRLEILEMAERPTGDVTATSSTRLVLDDVGYDYDGTPAIEAISFALEPGDVVGIIGPSGGGKSTLVQVLLRLRLPTRGRVIFGDHPYADIDSSTWSRLVAVVPQEPRLFEGTIAENIEFFRPDISRQAVEHAARAANVFDEIDGLDDGFDTRLGPLGGGLSGGQQQRVTIARALVGHPALLILDEPTSALDSASEAGISETIEGLRSARQTTVVIVSHRMDTLRRCDRVMVMRRGRITSVGTLEDALEDLDMAR